MIRRILILMVIIGLLAPLGACGRKGALQPPPGSDYPREYPTQ